MISSSVDAVRWSKRFLSVGLFSVVTGSLGSAYAAEAPENCSRISFAAEGHTCGHGRSGPFASRAAVPYPAASPAGIPNVDPTHTLYTLLLSGESETQEWVVSYKPYVSGWYAIFLDLPGTEVILEQPFPYELRDAFGQPVPVRLEHVITGCPGYLAWVKVYDLEAARYHLVFNGNPNDNVQVAIEHVDVMGQYLYVDEDGDGFGVGSGLASWCGGADGYAALEGDCDDDDPLVFPDENEVCEIPEEPCEESGNCPNGMAGAGSNPSASGGSPNQGSTGGGAPEGGESGDPSGGATLTGGNSSNADGGGDADDDGLAGGSSDGPLDDGSEGDAGGGGCSCQVGGRSAPGDVVWWIALFGYLLARRQNKSMRRWRKDAAGT